MSKSGRSEIQALVQMSYPTSSHSDERIVSLRIEDGASGMVLFEANIAAEDWVAIQSTGGTRVDATVTAYPERIGRQMVVESRHLGYVTDAEAVNARLAALDDGWDTAEVQRTNRGLRLVMRKWPAPDGVER